jgi:hypothetical protein
MFMLLGMAVMSLKYRQRALPSIISFLEEIFVILVSARVFSLTISNFVNFKTDSIPNLIFIPIDFFVILLIPSLYLSIIFSKKKKYDNRGSRNKFVFEVAMSVQKVARTLFSLFIGVFVTGILPSNSLIGSFIDILFANFLITVIVGGAVYIGLVVYRYT